MYEESSKAQTIPTQHAYTWNLRSSGILRSTFRTGVSGQPTGPIFKGQEIQEETSLKNYHYMLCNNPEERRSHILRGGSLESRIPTHVFQTSSLTSCLIINGSNLFNLYLCKIVVCTSQRTQFFQNKDNRLILYE